MRVSIVFLCTAWIIGLAGWAPPVGAQSAEDVEVQKQALFALSQVHTPESARHLLDIARTHPQAEIRKQAIFWLGQRGEVALLQQLEADAPDDADVLEQLVFAYAQLPGGEGVPRLIELATKHRNPEVRKQAIFWLGQSGDPRAAEVLLRLAKG